MKKYTQIQWLGAEQKEAHSDEASIQRYRWSVVDAQFSVELTGEGNQHEMLEALSDLSHPIIVLMPGEKVVSQIMQYSEKEKRHFAKMLPYELEDQVVEDIDELHFAVGKKAATSANVAYIDHETMESVLSVFVENDLAIDRCIADYQLLNVEDNEVVLWFAGQRLSVHTDQGVGFSGDGDMALLMLQAMLSASEEQESINYRVFITEPLEGETPPVARETIERIFYTLLPDARLSFHTRLPARHFNSPLAIDLCCGDYAQQAPVSQQLKEFKIIGLLAVVAIMAFVGVNSADIYALNLQNQQQKALIEKSYRKVIPRGVVNNPVRQLERRLGQAANTSEGEPSQVIYLLSHVAPVIEALEVDLSTVNYSNKEKSLRISVQADSFNQVEKIRTDINAKGLSAELLSSNAVDDKFQARLLISLEGK